MKKISIRGFSLLELMIVVVVLGLLAAVAYPSYTDQIRKGRRNDGRSALMTTAQAMERYFTENSTYNGPALGATSSIGRTSSQEGYYTISFDSAPTGGSVCGTTDTSSTSATAYRICATPTGAQATDSCGTLSISSTGVKTPTSSGCW